MVDLSIGRWSPLPDVWGITGSVVSTRSFNLDVPSDPRPYLHGHLELLVLWSIYSGPLLIHNGTVVRLELCIQCFQLIHHLWNSQSVVPSQSKSLSPPTWLASSPGGVMFTRTIPQWLRTLPVRMQSQTCYHPGWRTNVHAPNGSLLFTCMIRKGSLCVSHQSIPTNRIDLICILAVNLTKWALQWSSVSKIDFSNTDQNASGKQKNLCYIHVAC